MVTRHDVDEPSVKEGFWNTLRRDPADPRDIARAYWRFTRASAPRRAPFRLGRWLVVGFVAGVGAVSAATVARHVVARWTTLNAREGSSTNPNLPVRSGTLGRHRSPSGLASALTAPSPAPDMSAAESPQSEMPPTPRRAALSLPDDHAPPVLDPNWRRVSEALRANDYATAETALRELETRGAPSDREAASLSLSQILLARGRTSEARPRLERLSEKARSSLVRQKASTLLASLK